MITDERLKELIDYFNIDRGLESKEIADEIQGALDELILARAIRESQGKMILSLRSQKKALIEDGERLVQNCDSLVKNIPDCILDDIRDIWGNTNVAVIQHWKFECGESIDAHAALLKSLESEQPKG